jgi:hypothetical protein
MQELAAGDHERGVAGPVEPPADRGRCMLDDLLEVVQDDQAAAAPGDRVAELAPTSPPPSRISSAPETTMWMPSSERASDRSQK